MVDDDRWKAVTTVGYLAHPEMRKHRPCRSHAVNVTLPGHRLKANLSEASRLGDRMIKAGPAEQRGLLLDVVTRIDELAVG